VMFLIWLAGVAETGVGVYDDELGEGAYGEKGRPSEVALAGVWPCKWARW
jgi:hypothetical protein